MSETVYTHVATEETLQRVAVSLERIANQKELIWDDVNNCYTNQSIATMLAATKNGLAYGVSIPKGSTTACTKIGANAGIANPTPGYVGTPAIDPYAQLGPFVHYDVNGYVDADGTPHVTAIEGDGNFKRDGSNGDVWVLAPVLWWKIDESGNDAVTISVSDSKLPGLSAQPQAYLPDGTLRPYMLYAKYAGCQGADGYMHSYSGKAAWNRSVSHNSLITQCRTATTGYSGKSVADDWYVKTMFLLKYATKNSQSVFAGCTGYYLDYQPAVAETGVTRVIIAKASAANLVVGSSVSLGSSRSSNSVLGNTRILKIEDYDTNNSAVYLDVASSFDTTTELHLSTMPWHAGSCDMVEGDGSVSQVSLTNGKAPFVLQGIECMVGMYEVLGGAILHYDGTSGGEPCICYDSRDDTTSLTSDFTHTGKSLATGAADGWQYPLYPSSAGGLLFGASSGASTSTGMCDGHYMKKDGTSGDYEWLGVGDLYDGASAGLWYGGGNRGLSHADWSIGSRLSGTGRSRAAA